MADDLTPEQHRDAAVVANTSTWELLDGRSLDAVGADELLQRAYAAAYHWQRAAGATSVNAARASWLLSRSHAVLGHGELARHHAERCAKHTDAAGGDAADFDRAYALEARARASACLGDGDDARSARAEALAIEIADDEDRALVHADIAAEPWFGVDGD